MSLLSLSIFLLSPTVAATTTLLLSGLLSLFVGLCGLVVDDGSSGFTSFGLSGSWPASESTFGDSDSGKGF